LREIGQGSLRAVNANERNAGLLSSLGLDQLFDVESLVHGEIAVPANALHETTPVTATVGGQRETVLAAHEALVAVDASNETKFRDVLDYLRQELNVPASDDA
jgi:hypothetical protein